MKPNPETLDSFFIPPEPAEEHEPDMTMRVDESNADYHGDLAYVSNSTLNVFRQSRQRYRQRFVTKELPSPSPTAAMLLGTNSHLAVLEPAKFAKLEPFGTRCEAQKKGGEQCSNAPLGTHEGKWLCGVHSRKVALDVPESAISYADKQQAARLADAVKASEEGRYWLCEAEGVNEVSIRWKDGRTGIQCKCRPDRWLQTENIVVDLKTTTDASPDAFAKKCAQLGYHRQAAWYQDGVEAATGKRPQFVFVAVSTSEPYDVGVYELDQDALTLGRHQNQSALDQLATCLRNDDWLSPWQKRVITLSLPKFAQYEDEYDLYA